MSILVRTLEFETTEDGVIPEGFLSASFKNVGNLDALVNGVILRPGDAKTYGFRGKAREALSYVATGTALQIMYDI